MEPATVAILALAAGTLVVGAFKVLGGDGSRGVAVRELQRLLEEQRKHHEEIEKSRFTRYQAELEIARRRNEQLQAELDQRSDTIHRLMIANAARAAQPTSSRPPMPNSNGSRPVPQMRAPATAIEDDNLEGLGDGGY